MQLCSARMSCSCVAELGNRKSGVERMTTCPWQMQVDIDFQSNPKVIMHLSCIHIVVCTNR